MLKAKQNMQSQSRLGLAGLCLKTEAFCMLDSGVGGKSRSTCPWQHLPFCLFSWGSCTPPTLGTSGRWGPELLSFLHKYASATVSAKPRESSAAAKATQPLLGGLVHHPLSNIHSHHRLLCISLDHPRTPAGSDQLLTGLSAHHHKADGQDLRTAGEEDMTPLPRKLGWWRREPRGCEEPGPPWRLSPSWAPHSHPGHSKCEPRITPAATLLLPLS